MRRQHTDSRTSENFTERGLQSLTGQSTRKWTRYITKELLDNSLEAVEDDEGTDCPRIHITVTADTTEAFAGVNTLTVRDSGPGVSDERIQTIFGDVTQFAGSKRHYALPTRGNQGNALMTILGIQDGADGDLIVQTNGTRYDVSVVTQTRSGSPEVAITSAADSDAPDPGLAVTVDISGAAYGTVSQVEETVAKFAALNPHAEFELSVGVRPDDTDPTVTTYPADPDSTVERLSLAKAATTGKVTWFSLDEFRDRVRADVAAAPDLTLDEFVREFKGLSSRSKRTEVFETLETHPSAIALNRTTTVSDLFTNEANVSQPREAAIKALYQAMQMATTEYSEAYLDSSLGRIGEDLLDSTVRYVEQTTDAQLLRTSLSGDGDPAGGGDLDDFDVVESSVYYHDSALVPPASDENQTLRKAVPFTFELAAVPTAISVDSQQSSTVLFGLNQSVTYEEPSVNLTVSHLNKGERSYRSVSEAFNSVDHGFTVFTNLTCPNIDYADKGKQTFDTAPFTDVISGVVGKAIRKLEKDVRPQMNDIRKAIQKAKEASAPDDLDGTAHKGFIKEFIYDDFEDAYSVGTEGGTYTITMRQLYYVMRPRFHETADQRGYQYAHDATRADPKPLTLKYKTFSDNVKQYEEEERGERVVARDDRGEFVEPHGNSFEISTATANAFDPDLNQYGNLLLVEKTGFGQLIHNEFKLTKQYDVGLVQTQGYATLAARDIVEQVQSAGDVKLWTLTDLDVAGLGIAVNATDPDELSPVADFDAERLGVAVADVADYDLATEPCDYSDSKKTELTNKVEAGEVAPETAEFLLADGGQRVEINAFSPVELRDYLETKFEEVGIEKVEPVPDDLDVPDVDSPDNVHDDAVTEAVGDWVRSQTGDTLHEALDNQADLPAFDGDLDEYTDEATVRKTLHDDIIEALADYPSKNWEALNKERVAELEIEAAAQLDAHADAVKDDVRRFLDENVTVDVNITTALDGDSDDATEEATSQNSQSGNCCGDECETDK